jgi:uncharacterized membrane protein
MKPRTFNLSRAGAWLLPLGLAAGALFATPTFVFLGELPGGSDYSVALGVSADGTYVVGESSSTTSGPIDPGRLTSGTEAFIWNAGSGMVGLGFIPNANTTDFPDVSSSAAAVSADGSVVVGKSGEVVEIFGGAPSNPVSIGFAEQTFPFRWVRTSGNTGTMTELLGFLRGGLRPGSLAATAVSSDGSVVTGNSGIRIPISVVPPGGMRGFVWSPSASISLGSSTSAFDVSPNGRFIVGAVNPTATASAYRKEGTGESLNLGQIGGASTKPASVSADGKLIVGSFTNSTGGTSAFLWQQGSTPIEGTFGELPGSLGGAAGISAAGRVIVDAVGSLYLDEEGPYDLREILAAAGAIDLRHLSPALFVVRALSDDGLAIVGSAVIDGKTRAWRARLSDCDQNGLPDELERLTYHEHALSITSQLEITADGSGLFASDTRDSLGYGTMIERYGRPWQPEEDRIPSINLDQPAECLRAILRHVLERPTRCVYPTVVPTEAADFFLSTVLPALSELHDFQMLLGNEALADALDPTVGMDGVEEQAGLGNQFAFKRVRGINDLIDEELALLRGRELPGGPADWVKEDVYYPEFISSTEPTNSVRAAVYNRLPPNAVNNSDGAAYRSNYRVADNFEAAVKFPQGHGDAYGHYLTAIKAGITLLSTVPAAAPAAVLDAELDSLASDEAALEVVRDLAAAGVARAEAASNITDLLFRRDYTEDPQNPRARRLFTDTDVAQRAWSMADWARRGALGAYLDWAVANQLAPADPSRPVNRGELAELDELAGAASALQERLDTLGAGLDPLGLVQNVVPFGIDSSGLEPSSGQSHFDQVHEAARKAVENAGLAFQVANQANQRLRDADRSLQDFSDQLEDTRADLDQQLIEIFGLPSPDDTSDNDFDPGTPDFEESQAHPDLRNFLFTDERLARFGLGPRAAPGEAQIAISELQVASLRLDQAEVALDNHAAQVRSKMERIDLVRKVQSQRLTILAEACQDEMDLIFRMEDIERRKRMIGLFSSLATAAVTPSQQQPVAIVSYVTQYVSFFGDALGWDNEFDIERERKRIQCWKESRLQGLEDVLHLDAEKRDLEALIRQIPQLIVDRAIQVELTLQASGRLLQALNRGQLLLRKKQRLVARTSGNLLETRWKDLSFRLFRHAVLKNYRSFFDLAARYVVLAGRAYAYEFDKRSDGENILAGIYRERRLGSASGVSGGLQAVLKRLQANADTENFNHPFDALGTDGGKAKGFSLRSNLLGIDNREQFPRPDLRFRAFLEQSIVERIEDLEEIRELAQVHAQRHHGPGIVISFSTELDGRNFFGQGPDLPFGNANFSATRNVKIRNFAIRFDGVDPGPLGADPQSGSVDVYFIPAGDSVLRENTNKPDVEDELVTRWAVVDQFLPPPLLAAEDEVVDRAYNPWVSMAEAGGNFLNEIKRHRDAEAQIELGQSEHRFNTGLAGRSAWNTRWVLIIPGRQWTSSSDPAVIRHKLLQFIYGATASPTAESGITDIRLVLQGYAH